MHSDFEVSAAQTLTALLLLAAVLSTGMFIHPNCIEVDEPYGHIVSMDANEPEEWWAPATESKLFHIF